MGNLGLHRSWFGHFLNVLWFHVRNTSWYSSTLFCSQHSGVTHVGGGALVPTQCSLATSGCLGLCSLSLRKLSQPALCISISKSSTVLLAPHWAWSNMSISFFHWEVQSWRLFQVQSERCPMVRNNHVFWLSGYNFVNTAQYAFGPHVCKSVALDKCSTCFLPEYRLSFAKLLSSSACSQSIQIHGVILTQEWDLAVFFTEICDISWRSSL